MCTGHTQAASSTLRLLILMRQQARSDILGAGSLPQVLTWLETSSEHLQLKPELLMLLGGSHSIQPTPEP